MFEKFTERARKVMALANQQAERFNHEYIGTEHILLGLVMEGSGVAVAVLKNLGAEPAAVRAAVEELIKAGPDVVAAGSLPLTPRAKQVIEHACEQAHKLNHHYLGTEHLLLGLMAVTEGVAARVLAEMGVSAEAVEAETKRVLAEARPAPRAAVRRRAVEPTPRGERRGEEVARPQRVAITGASTETGPFVAKAFAATGAALVLTYHSNQAAGAAVQEACLEAGAAEASLLQLDLLDNGQCAGFVAKAAEAMGGLDALIEVAAAGPTYTPLAEIGLADFQKALQGQITGNFLIARDAGNFMKAHDGGRIVLFSATSSLKYHHASYGFAKAAINELTKYLAFEMAPKVTVNTIVPGLIDLESTDAELRRTRAAASPLRRIVTPAELGAMCVAICSPLFDTVTGQTLILDGGFFLKPAPDAM